MVNSDHVGGKCAKRNRLFLLLSHQILRAEIALVLVETAQHSASMGAAAAAAALRTRQFVRDVRRNQSQ